MTKIQDRSSTMHIEAGSRKIYISTYYCGALELANHQAPNYQMPCSFELHLGNY